MKPERPPLSQVIIYALGQFGWSLAIFGAANLLIYFYLPPETNGSSLFPTYIFQGAVFGVATLIGLASAGGRIFDAITDPLVAGWSDRLKAGMGKRRKLMSMAAFPLALFSFLIFLPPTADNLTINGIWVTILILLLYFALTLYVIPYMALTGELGHHPDDRMKISTAISIAWSLGFVVGSNVYALQSLLENFYPSTTAFQISIGGFAVLSLVLLLAPVLFLQEVRYAKQLPSDTKPWPTIRNIFREKSFAQFVLADGMYWLAVTFIQLGVSYYVTTLFYLDKSLASVFLTVGFITSFLMYWPVYLLVGRFGKKKTVVSGFVVFCALFILTVFVPYLPGNKTIWFYVLAVSSGYPLAVFGIIPNALIADMIYQYEARTGESKAALFFGIRNFTSKSAIGVANFLFPTLLLFGKSNLNYLGVQLTAALAAMFCLIGMIYFLKFRESGNH